MNDNKDSNYDPKNVNDEIEIQTSNNKVNNFEKSSKSEIENKDYNFGWNKYSEITNGRFAMIGIISIFIIELISGQSFLHWAGIIN